MLGWLKGRSGKQNRPVWRQWYNVLLEQATEPAWLPTLKEPSAAIEGRFLLREEAPDWTFRPEMVGGDAEMQRIADACPALAVISCAYEGDEKVFLTIARLAFHFAAQEAGVVTNASAQRFYRAADYAEGFREFALEDHIQVQQVGPDAAGRLWLHTHGLMQFGLPELEVTGVPPELVEAASHFLLFTGEWMMGGERIGVGHTLEAPGHPGVWAIIEPVPPREGPDHADIGVQVLRVSDYDPKTNRPSPGLDRFLRTLAEDAGAEAETVAAQEPQAVSGRPLWLKAFAVILLLWAVGQLLRIPDRLETMLALPSSPFTGDLAWLATFGLPWPAVARTSAVTAFLRAAGVGLAAVGLLARRTAVTTAGLIGFAVALLSDLPMVPLGIAIALGRVQVDPAILGRRGVPAADWPTAQAWAGAIVAFMPIAYFGLLLWLLGQRRKLVRDVR